MACTSPRPSEANEYRLERTGSVLWRARTRHSRSGISPEHSSEHPAQLTVTPVVARATSFACMRSTAAERCVFAMILHTSGRCRAEIRALLDSHCVKEPGVGRGDLKAASTATAVSWCEGVGWHLTDGARALGRDIRHGGDARAARSTV